MRRRNDLGMRGEPIEVWRLRVHRIQAMQQQDRRTLAHPQDLEVDVAQCESLDPHGTPYMRSLIRIAILQPALIAADNSR
jgi:hypothetical protein